MNVHNKTVWITGASSGIGEALVYAFAAKNCAVILSSRRKDELERVRIKAGLNENNSLVLPLDLECTEQINDALNTALQKFPVIDFLVNNGGVSQRANAADTPLSLDRKIMEVNYFGTIALTKALLPHMLNNKNGYIVVISSIAGKFGYYLRSAYAAAKHALHGFFESLRLEIHKENVRVLLVCPGKIKTNISVKALNADGSHNNKMEDSHAQAMSAEECARIIIEAIENNKEEIYIGGKELKAVWIKRFFPKLFLHLMKKQKPE